MFPGRVFSLCLSVSPVFVRVVSSFLYVLDIFPLIHKVITTQHFEELRASGI